MSCPIVSASALGNLYPICWQKAAHAASEAGISADKWVPYRTVRMHPRLTGHKLQLDSDGKSSAERLEM